MPIERTLYAGSWPDVGILADGRIVLTHLARRMETPALTCVIGGAQAWRVSLSEGGLYQRMALSATGRVVCAWQGVSGQLWVSLDGQPAKARGNAFGQNGVGCYWNGFGDNPRVVVQRSATQFETIDGANGVLLDAWTVPATSQGVRDVLPDGAVILGDAAIRTTRYGWVFSNPTTRDIWTAGQTDPKAIRLARSDSPYVTTAIQGDAFEPHVAVWGATVAVCARTLEGVTLAVLTPPYPAHEPFVNAAPTIAPFTFPTALTWFFEDSKRPSVTPSPAPGQWSLIVESGLNPRKPVLIGLTGDDKEDLVQEWAGRWTQVRGIYVDDEASRNGLQSKARFARARMRALNLPTRPIYSYSAGNVWTDIPEIDHVGVQCYPDPGESRASMTARWRPAFLKLKAAGRQSAVVGGFYDRRPLNVSAETVTDGIAVCAELAAEFKAQILAFAWGRIGGAASMPALLPSLFSLAAAVVTLPEPPVASTPPVTPKPPTPERPPMPFPTDAEHTDFAEQLEALYRDEMQRTKRDTYIDPLGAARWYGDFRTDALTMGATAASRKILNEIRAIVGLPPANP